MSGAENEKEEEAHVGVCYNQCVHIESTSLDSVFPPKAIFLSR